MFFALTALSCSCLALTLAQEAMPGAPEACIDGYYHKDAPSAETTPFEACGSWQMLSCCSYSTARNISRYGSRMLYDFRWDLCGNLSTECENYIRNEQCFYECEPMLDYFQLRDTPAVFNIPVCASYCDEWFEACRNDHTCVENWLDTLERGIPNDNCPANLTCVTFAEMFENGRGLCNRMWGNTFFYSEDEDNCTVMEFDPTMPNPNLLLTFAGGEMIQSSILITGILMLVSIIVE